ncbi:hypothetical protein [Paenibacillus tarimensis]|uniref:hypothetical protein n=1 Tax=Paenibacillus tarimensis TaxID=416012 RepID=UPI001F474808|nr:hypothetical protein [Paenibacillus tarimensis]MCF2946260.1 hypothetical protein [Paenibacillus tarimensis]
MADKDKEPKTEFSSVSDKTETEQVNIEMDKVFYGEKEEEEQVAERAAAYFFRD